MKIIDIIFSKCPPIRYLVKSLRGKAIVYNYYNTKYDKNCLFMYVLEPFLRNEIDESHQLFWQELQITKLLSDKGYNIDIIDYDNKYVHLVKKYDLIFDLIPGRNMVYMNHMTQRCIRIAYLTGSNATFQNKAEKQRIEAIARRRGKKLKTRRQSPYITNIIEEYNACLMIGNRYNWRTYSEFNLSTPFFIKNNGHYQKYNFNKLKKKSNAFLYFGSVGSVHKGLDLLLEIFSEKNFPAELYVCGTFDKERDFVKCYYKELYECDNIHPVGFVKINSDKFRDLTEICTYSILPSCSEANAGTILSTMSAGLISICSYECGFEDDEVIHLKNCDIATIREVVLYYSKKDYGWIKEKSKASYDIVQQRYSKENFVDSIKNAFDVIL